MNLEEIKIMEWKHKIKKLWTQVYINGNNKILFPTWNNSEMVTFANSGQWDVARCWQKFGKKSFLLRDSFQGACLSTFTSIEKKT